MHLGGMKAPEEQRRYWSTMITRFERSGLSQAKFAGDAGVGEAILRYWLYKFRRERAALVPVGNRSPDDVRLVPMQVRRPMERTGVEVRMAGVRVLLPIGVEPTYIAQVAVALRAAITC